jgi:hypothetical protein
MNDGINWKGMNTVSNKSDMRRRDFNNDYNNAVFENTRVVESEEIIVVSECLFVGRSPEGISKKPPHPSFSVAMFLAVR